MSTPTCHHLFADLHRCGSPALRNQKFCYFHHPDRRPVGNPIARRARRGFTITTPRDHRSRQQALTELVQRLASNSIDLDRARLILYSLQILSQKAPL